MSSAAAASAHAPTRMFKAASPVAARVLLALVIVAAVAAGLLAAGLQSPAAVADPDLTRLLRAMAVMKSVMAAGAAAAVLWRLGAAVAWPWLASYAAACAAMTAGPGLIWGMAHVGLGAALLHGGLLATGLLLWRDPAVGSRLSAIVAVRRAALRAGG